MKVIWWFGLEPGTLTIFLEPGTLTIFMPKGAVPLYVSRRQGQPVLYVLCDPDVPREHRKILIVPTTGEPFDPTGFLPIGVIEPEQNLFFHVFVEA